MEDEKQVEQDRHRAEVFDALGHPTRIAIVKVLSEGSLGFADLKKIDIGSSGHLQHHLTKLNGLIKTDEYGKYCLSDEGKDALLTVQTVEKSSLEKAVKDKSNKRFFGSRLGIKYIAFILAAILIVSSIIALSSPSHFIFTQNLELQNIAIKGPDYFQNGPAYQTVNDITLTGKTVGQVIVIAGPPYINSSGIPLLIEIQQSPDFKIDSIKATFSSSVKNQFTYEPDFYLKPNTESNSQLADVYSNLYPNGNDITLISNNNVANQGKFYQELVFSPTNPDLSEPLEFYINLSIAMHENGLIQFTSLRFEGNITLNASALVP